MSAKNFFVNEKAVIEILDLREFGNLIERQVPSADKAAASYLNDNALKNMAQSPEATSGMLDLLNNAEISLKKLSGLDTLTMAGTKKTFEVQFNPSDLHLEGYGGGRIATTVYNKDDGSSGGSGNIVYAAAPVNINLSVKLLFDRMDASESFLSAKTNIAVSELAKSAVSTALKKANKKLTVQQEVEGLVAALRSPYTRKISFCWGDLCYTGVLNRVASQYTMFNTAGEPVRAYVQLSLICADESVSDASMGQWEQAYEKAFNGGSKSMTDWTQKAGSVLNFSK